MNISMRVGAEFTSVFLVNGKLFESGELIFGDSEVVYITAFPLDAILLPYTVKLLGGRVLCNTDLARCYALGRERFYLKLLPRHNYVYSVNSNGSSGFLDEKTAKRGFSGAGGSAERFFTLVVSKKTDSARKCLCKELGDSINDSDLLKFFDGYTDIIAEDADKGLFYLITNSGNGVLYEFVLKGNLIENIIEV